MTTILNITEKKLRKNFSEISRHDACRYTWYNVTHRVHQQHNNKVDTADVPAKKLF